MEKKRRVLWLENALIIMAIAALWPGILHWPDRITRPFLYLALVTMVVIARRRWRRLMNLKTAERDEVRHKGTKVES
ncbi:MAG: hypothetical protein WC081_03385 [Candidatus Ratteibacteria bacterium]|jgi:hypothetical protein